ncbi:MAG: DUF488 family protein [Gemmatales bacterium]|nr:DUF488 family protein [Gemmatales bacterium]MCS7160385.1 DUF488 family protein [Gemmatales bacterium]MDW8175585.1 DUF488 family protein [Gemmatales bacterium]MDW8224060.1 DUF488 family protein [Gemmatales bacterium]
MPIRTKRWNDPVEADDGFRLLITRYRPRGVARKKETWDEWWPELGPSRELHAAYWGKIGPPIPWAEYRRRYLAEVRQQKELLACLLQRLRQGETITLLCSSACVEEKRCHRSLLKKLLEEKLRHSAG